MVLLGDDGSWVQQPPLPLEYRLAEQFSTNSIVLSDLQIPVQVS